MTNWNDKMDAFINEVAMALETKYANEEGIEEAKSAVECAKAYKKFACAKNLDYFIAYLDGINDQNGLWERWFAIECIKHIRMYAVALKFAK